MTILMNRSPGFPEHGGGQLQAHRLAGDELEIRRQLFLLAVGIAVTFALFLALPFMQVVSSAAAAEPKILEPIALPVPKQFVPPPPPVTPEKPVDEKPILKPEKPFIPYDQLVTPVNPNGPGVPIHGITWDPGQLIPEIYDPVHLDRAPSPIHTVAPDVPRGLRQGGNVLLEFIVTPQGSVAGIKVISSTHPAFERPAVTALAKWRFEPGVKNNASVSTRMRLPIQFSIGQ